MDVNVRKLKEHVQGFDFKGLFNELGWDHLRLTSFSLTVENTVFTFQPVAQKRGFQVFEVTTSGRSLPSHALRMKLERELGKTAYEHLIVFVDEAKTRQLWQWTRREQGKPLALRTSEYLTGTTGESLVQKLSALAFSLEEEEGLTITEVAGRTKKALDVEKVTKRFFDLYQKQHTAFYKQVDGLPDDARSWYTSLMLNRLMFIYFVQKKRFLDNNADYLRDRLAKVQAKYGAGKFQNFYQHFLLALFHEGLGKDKQQRQLDPEMLALLGNVPYLNGGLFEVHRLEDEYKGKISIPDEAFETVFSFFEGYEWHLDDRPMSQGNEINPDVLGYIFEKYINQKQMGAYYTKEDITEYISKNTVLPYILQTVANDCQIAFAGERSVWRLLAEAPDRYIYDAVKHGANEPLPSNIEAGIEDVSKRADWNRSAPRTHALPTEIWREVVVRRVHYQEVRAKLAKGEIKKVEDLITLNLNIRQFTQDALDTAEGSELVKAFWKALTTISILDPTCGSGAFLFAALNILQPLYEATIDKMQSLVNEADAANNKQKYADFRKTLAEVSMHANERYFVLKTIVVNNLYGVDIMEEATEIAKLRLFLKLMSQVESPGQIEPLPDVDFNIRAGNALVGFANLEGIKRSFSGRIDFQLSEQQIIDQLEELELLFKHFKLQQTEYGGVVTNANKKALKEKLSKLEEELNRHLTAQYGVDPNDAKAYSDWKTSHQPFHWFVDFYGIMKKGGFDAIIGNPPYVEYSAIKSKSATGANGKYRIQSYVTEESGNLYAFMTERGLVLLSNSGLLGFIIPVASVCTDGYSSLQRLLVASGDLFISNYNDRPGKLFDGIEHIRLSIILSKKNKSSNPYLFTSKYHRWQTIERTELFEKLMYTSPQKHLWEGSIPKMHSSIEQPILSKISAQGKMLGNYLQESGTHEIFYTRKLSGFVQILDFIPAIYDSKNKLREPSELKALKFNSERTRDVFLTLLNSNLFYWFLTLYSDVRNLNKRELLAIPFSVESADSKNVSTLSKLSQQLMADFRANSKILDMSYKALGTLKIQCIYPKFSKPIIDQIDQVLAKHYGFTDEELDFIINYDIKYRMGRGDEEGYQS
jgi:hypothetical protein